MKYLYPSFTWSRSLLVIISVAFIMNTNVSGQAYNKTYEEMGGNQTVEAKGNSLLDVGCQTSTVNSILNGNGFYDFQLMFVDNAGAFNNAYTFGNPNGNDFCNAYCQDMYNPSEYILCGRSANNHMLVMKVNDSGSLLWSKEIDFGPNGSEAVEILPHLGSDEYVVVGNYGNEIAAASFSGNGDYNWAYEYPMDVTYASNQVTDIVHLSTPTPTNLSKIGIVGNHNTATSQDVFMFSIYAINGEPWEGAIYSHDAGYNIRQPQIIEAEDESEDFVVSISQNQNTFGGSQKDISVFKSTLNTPEVITWSSAFNYPDMFSTVNQGIIRTNSNEFTLLGTTHPTFNPSAYYPHLTTIDPSGFYISTTVFNDLEIEFAETAQNLCNDPNGNEILIKAYNKNTSFQNRTRLIKHDNTTDCSNSLIWDNISPQLNAAPVDITAVPLAVMVNYPTSINQIEVIELDCTEAEGEEGGGDERRDQKTGTARGQGEAQWIYPNPANTEVNLILGENEIIRIYDPSGRMVYNQIHSYATRISVEEMNTGFYLVTRTNPSGDRLIHKLMIK